MTVYNEFTAHSVGTQAIDDRLLNNSWYSYDIELYKISREKAT